MRAEGTTGDVPAAVELKDLRVGGPPAVFVARVVSAAYREVVRKSDGGRRPVLSGLLTDGTATVRFTWWDPPREGVERGTVLRAANAQVQEFRGQVEVAFNWRTHVEPASDADLPQVASQDLPLRALIDLAARDENIRVEGRILEINSKPVTVRGERRLIFEGLLGDASGVRAFTAWTDFGLKAGETVRITGVYVRTFRGRPQLTLDERSRIERIPGLEIPSTDALRVPPLTSISRLQQDQGAEFVAVEGLVIGLLPTSGVVYRCPSCRRVLQKGLCRVHGAVAGAPDLRARVVLDDGTGALTANLGRELTESLSGRSLDSYLADLRAQPDPSRIEEDLFERLFGQRWRLEGHATRDDFGVTFFADRVQPASPEIPQLLADIQGRLFRTSP